MEGNYQKKNEGILLENMLREFELANISDKKIDKYLKNLKRDMKRVALYLSDYELDDYLLQAEQIAQGKKLSNSSNVILAEHEVVKETNEFSEEVESRESFGYSNELEDSLNIAFEQGKFDAQVDWLFATEMAEQSVWNSRPHNGYNNKQIETYNQSYSEAFDEHLKIWKEEVQVDYEDSSELDDDFEIMEFDEFEDFDLIELFDRVQNKVKSLGHNIQFGLKNNARKLKKTGIVFGVVLLCGCSVKGDASKSVPEETTVVESPVETEQEDLPVVEPKEKKELDASLVFDIEDMDHNVELMNTFFETNVPRGVDLTNSEISDEKKDVEATILSNINRWQDYFIVRNFDQITMEFLYDYLGNSSRTYSEFFENYMRTVDEICMKAITSTEGNEWTLDTLVASKEDAKAEQTVLKFLSEIATAQKNGDNKALEQAIKEAREFIEPFMNNNGFGLKPTTVYELSQLIQAGKQLLITSQKSSVAYLSEDEMLRLAAMEKDCGINKAEWKANKYSSTIMNDATGSLLSSMNDKFNAMIQFRIAKVLHESEKDEIWMRNEISNYIKENHILATFKASESLEEFLYGSGGIETYMKKTGSGQSSNSTSSYSGAQQENAKVKEGKTVKTGIAPEDVPEAQRQPAKATYTIDGKQIASATGEDIETVDDQLTDASNQGGYDAEADWESSIGSIPKRNPRPRSNYTSAQVAVYNEAYSKVYDHNLDVYNSADHYKHTTTEKFPKDEQELEDDRVTNGGILDGTSDEKPAYDQNQGTNNNGQNNSNSGSNQQTTEDYVPNPDGDKLVDQDVIDQGTSGGDIDETKTDSEVTGGGILPGPDDQSSNEQSSSSSESSSTDETSASEYYEETFKPVEGGDQLVGQEVTETGASGGDSTSSDESEVIESGTLSVSDTSSEPDPASEEVKEEPAPETKEQTIASLKSYSSFLKQLQSIEQISHDEPAKTYSYC